MKKQKTTVTVINKKSKILFLLIIILSASASISSAQQDTTLTKKEIKAQKKAQKLEEGKMMVSPLIMPGYTPELGFAIGGGGIFSWTNNKLDKELPRSNMPFSLALSSTGAVVVNLRPVTYWASDNLRLNGDIWYKDMPDNYWGIGYENAYEIPKSDTTTAYDREWFQFQGDALYRINGSVFGGLTFDANYTKGSNATELVSNDENYQVFNQNPFNAGIGAKIQYDSRDVPVNAYKGMLLSGSAMFYGPYLGGDNNYQVYTFDYRQYYNAGAKQGRVIAWQMTSRLSFGNVPYGEMSQLGTPFDLRGYTWGRYRDKSMFFWLAEYRHKIYKPDGTTSKSGVVAWIGSGTVFDLEKGSDYNDNSKWLPSFGVGYRFELQPRLNLRIDIGIGRETTGFYFNMNEAF